MNYFDSNFIIFNFFKKKSYLIKKKQLNNNLNNIKTIIRNVYIYIYLFIFTLF